LLPLVTVFEADKTVQHTQARFDVDMAGPVALAGVALSRPGRLAVSEASPPRASSSNPWAALAGVQVAGYEIHHGQTQQHPAMAKAGDVARAVMPGGLAWQSGAGNVLGLYLHGLFEDPAALQALFGAPHSGPVPTLDSVFDGLADYIEQHFEPGVLQALIA
jgi:adenosylcobyric acid synthase